jgi:uncharacterized membrane protein YeaQ/YmgE (transglycosylase-associated protein family)
MGFIASIVIGLLAGWLAGLLMKGGGYGIIADLALGLVGSVVGGWLGSRLLGIDLTTGFNLTTLLTSIAGAVLVIVVYRLITRRSVTG